MEKGGRPFLPFLLPRPLLKRDWTGGISIQEGLGEGEMGPSRSFVSFRFVYLPAVLHSTRNVKSLIKLSKFFVGRRGGNGTGGGGGKTGLKGETIGKKHTGEKKEYE